MSITLCLPFPVSANRLWRRAGNKIILSHEYRAWKIEAEGWFLQQKKSTEPIKGNFTYHLTLDKSKRSASRDGDNCGKAVLDFCQRMGLIEDDKLADEGTWIWGEADGCIIRIEKAA